MWGKPSRCCTWCSMSGCAVPVDRRWLRDGFTRHRCKLVLQTGLAWQSLAAAKRPPCVGCSGNHPLQFCPSADQYSALLPEAVGCTCWYMCVKQPRRDKQSGQKGIPWFAPCIYMATNSNPVFTSVLGACWSVPPHAVANTSRWTALWHTGPAALSTAPRRLGCCSPGYRHAPCLASMLLLYAAVKYTQPGPVTLLPRPLAGSWR